MSRIKEIRDRLGKPTQEDFGKAIGVTQGSVGFYERGEVLIPIDRAERLREYAASQGLTLTLDQIYGHEPLPEVESKTA